MKYLIKQSAHWSTKNWLLIYKIICCLNRPAWLHRNWLKREQAVVFQTWSWPRWSVSNKETSSKKVQFPLRYLNLYRLHRYSWLHLGMHSCSQQSVIGQCPTKLAHVKNASEIKLTMIETVLNLRGNELNAKLKHWKSQTSVISTRTGDSYRRFGNLCHTNRSGRPLDNLCFK